MPARTAATISHIMCILLLCTLLLKTDQFSDAFPFTPLPSKDFSSSSFRRTQLCNGIPIGFSTISFQYCPILFATLNQQSESELTFTNNQHRQSRQALSQKRKQHNTIIIQEVATWITALCTSATLSLIMISWEEISMVHPMRHQVALSRNSNAPSSILLPLWGQSTVRGMGFGESERLVMEKNPILLGLEPNEQKGVPSYNEVMLEHRTHRVPKWRSGSKSAISRDDVSDAVRSIQRALLLIQDCQTLVKEYEWDQVDKILHGKTFRQSLDTSCLTLQQAHDFLPLESRQLIGFDWGSCAWRHCGALADAQEALDELEHLSGVLEPFEALFCLDVVERSLRDILAITGEFQDLKLQSQIMDYQPLHRMSDIIQENNMDRIDSEYMETLRLLKNLDY